MIILCYLDMINDSMHVKKYETMVEFCYIVFYINLVTIFMRLLMMKKFTSNVMGDWNLDEKIYAKNWMFLEIFYILTCMWMKYCHDGWIRMEEPA